MKNIVLGAFALSIVTVSCKKDEKPTYLKEEASVQPSAMAMKPAPKTSILDQAGIQSTSGSGMSTVTSAGMNPPHGQPGHRCDIPVGQPLNSAPAQGAQNIAVNANQGQTVQIDPNSVQPGKFTVDANGKAKTTVTAKGMNPPHGEPGHRCDIPVGQPLNSKPAATAPVTAPAQPVQMTVESDPSANRPAPQVGEKPALNPAHGKPWHNCAVKVGEALP